MNIDLHAFPGLAAAMADQWGGETETAQETA